MFCIMLMRIQMRLPANFALSADWSLMPMERKCNLFI